MISKVCACSLTSCMRLQVLDRRVVRRARDRRLLQAPAQAPAAPNASALAPGPSYSFPLAAAPAAAPIMAAAPAAVGPGSALAAFKRAEAYIVALGNKSVAENSSGLLMLSWSSPDAALPPSVAIIVPPPVSTVVAISCALWHVCNLHCQCLSITARHGISD